MKKLFALLLSLALCLSVGALAAPDQDRAGEPIHLPETIEKIVSMAPSTTRVLTDLGLSDKLLAVDTYSAMYQPELASLPQFDMMTPDAEQLAALQPDVIFITGMSLAGGDNPYQALIDLGIAVVQIPSSNSIAAIQQDVLFIGECVGATEGAQALVDEMQAAIDEIAAIGATIQEKKRVAVEVAALPYLCYAGGNTYLDEMIRLIGADPDLHQLSGRSRGRDHGPRGLGRGRGHCQQPGLPAGRREQQPAEPPHRQRPAGDGRGRLSRGLRQG